MATSVEKALYYKRLQMFVNAGQDADGNVVKATRTYTRVNPNATKERIMAAADALAELMDETVLNVYDVEKNLLTKVEDEDESDEGDQS